MSSGPKERARRTPPNKQEVQSPLKLLHNRAILWQGGWRKGPEACRLTSPLTGSHVDGLQASMN